MPASAATSPEVERGAAQATWIVPLKPNLSRSGHLEPAPRRKASRGPKEEAAVNIRPLHDRIVAKRVEKEEEVRGGIIIPDSAKDKPQEAKVIAVGPGKLDENGKRLSASIPGTRSRSTVRTW
jgi:hypothetical protein